MGANRRTFTCRDVRAHTDAVQSSRPCDDEGLKAGFLLALRRSLSNLSGVKIEPKHPFPYADCVQEPAAHSHVRSESQTFAHEPHGRDSWRFVRIHLLVTRGRLVAGFSHTLSGVGS